MNPVPTSFTTTGQNYTINSAATNLVGGATRTGTVGTGATTAFGTAAQNITLGTAATNLGTTNVRFGSGNAYTTTTTGAVPASYGYSSTGGNVGVTTTSVARPAEYTSYSTGGQGYATYTTASQGAQFVQAAPQTYTTTQGNMEFNFSDLSPSNYQSRSIRDSTSHHKSRPIRDPKRPTNRCIQGLKSRYHRCKQRSDRIIQQTTISKTLSK